MKTSIILALFTATTSTAVVDSGNDNGTVNMEMLSDGETPASRPGVITKTIFSSKVRLTFWIGLEGTGHHLLLSSFDKAFKTQRGRHPGGGCTLAARDYDLTKSMGNDPGYYMEVLDHARADMQNLYGSESSAPATGAVETLCGYWSYPERWGPEKVMQYLDVALMAELAEAEGVDLRIIYLKRSALDIFVSTTVHRNFHRLPTPKENNSPQDASFMQYARILYTNAAVVHSYLAELDPKFVVCHDMKYVGDEEQASAIANFVAPTPEKAEALRSALLDLSPPRTSKNETLPAANAKVVVERLQRKLDIFESNYCRGRD